MATKISEFAAKLTAFNDRVDVAITGLSEDVQALTNKITELQNTPGAITPEDQALLDAIETRTETITTKLEALNALNENVPTPPPA
jgi:DNA repair exonuclease SbcCD ATPase subunit